MYRLLARLWLRELDAANARLLGSAPWSKLLAEVGATVPESDSDQCLEQLAQDYCQLFIGPSDHLPPYQSVWEDGVLQSTAASSMQTFAEIVGYPVAEIPPGTMLDHLGVQLDMLGYLLKQLGESLPPNGAAEQLASSFFAKHLQWPERLLGLAEQRAATRFYRGLVVVTREFLGTERAP